MSYVGRSRLLLPTSGQVRPCWRSFKLNRGNPLAAGLLFYGIDRGLALQLGVTKIITDLTGNAGDGVRQGVTNSSASFGTAINGISYLWSPSTGNRSCLSIGTPAVIQAATAAGNYSFACAFLQSNATPVSDNRPFGRTANNGVSQPFFNWGFDANPGGAGASTLTCAINNAGAMAQTTPNANFIVGAYTSAVGVLSGATLTLYVNGLASGTIGSITPASDNTNDDIIYAGSSAANINNRFSGQVFYGAFWARVLTPQEILRLHTDPYSFLLPGDEVPNSAVRGATAATGGNGIIDGGVVAAGVGLVLGS